ncbi:hypothetical protein [Amycolatopsis sp. lyj-109]|uniref:hypothetical protein n=1 Tax=Amycolatopsis sp. lyj-109 TaxID=2789287 RepID=UPI00397E58CD
MIPRGYTVPAVAAVVVVVALEPAVLRTGLFRRLAYWLTITIVTGFQIPVEDFLVGFALVTAVLVLWERGNGSRE